MSLLERHYNDLEISVKKTFVVFGTRPEAIKMAPVIEELKKNAGRFDVVVCVTGQHREMLHQVIDWFSIDVDYDLDLMKENQFVSAITVNALQKIEEILDVERPDIVLVQGDTTTAFAGALAAYYQKIPVGYVESGLRTWNKYDPFPEEINRVLLSHLADLHFAPTELSKANLEREGIDSGRIFVTGNTVIDALLETVDKHDREAIVAGGNRIRLDNRYLLVTSHRRDNFGAPLKNICLALKRLIETDDSGLEVIFPVHSNPNVRRVVFDLLGDVEGVHLIEPVEYPTFCDLMAKSDIILTDSGGIQEEAPSLGKPVLVLREATERPEAVEAGSVKVIGTRTEDIIRETRILLDDPSEYQRMAQARNPYGDGRASERIVKLIEAYL